MGITSYQGYLFDWDGCLADTTTIWLEGYRQTFAKFGKFPTDLEITAKAFGDWHAFENFGITNGDEFNQHLLKYVYRFLSDPPLNEGVKSAISRLKLEGAKLAIVTSSEKAPVLKSLEHHALSHQFDLVLGREDVVHPKPHPEIIFKALEILSLPPQETIIIGDTQNDILAGHQAKIATCLYQPKRYQALYNYDYLKVNPPDSIIEHFDDLNHAVQDGN